jgi:hypothetical protein
MNKGIGPCAERRDLFSDRRDLFGKRFRQVGSLKSIVGSQQ